MQLTQRILLCIFGLLALACLEIQSCLPIIIAPIAGALGLFQAGRHVGGMKGEQLPGSAFKGCYADSINRRAMGYPVYQSPGMTKFHCSDRCKDAKKKYMGLQNGTECYCGENTSDYEKYGAISNLKCDVPCGGEIKEMCGGYMALSVYES